MNQLRPYQSDLVEQLRQSWREGFKAPCIVLPCGGGKSCILAEIARRTTANGMRCMRYREGKRAVIIDHVGNYARFGLPDDDREWSLEGKPKKRREQQENIKAKMCPECFLTFSPPETGELICPHCGYIFPQKERKEIEQTSGELHKIEGFKIRYDRPEDCKSYKELLEYAKRHNYKAGWAYHMAVKRGIFSDRA